MLVERDFLVEYRVIFYINIGLVEDVLKYY